jgi:DNA helicase HerA-like ATPase
VGRYPVIGDAAQLIGARELRLIFDRSGPGVIELGRLAQDGGIAAYANATDMLSKHFAVLGTTGVGKSSAVALLIQQITQARSDLRVFLLDAHNEYGRCFGERAQVLSPRNLKLPFWLFNLDEMVDVLFGGRPGLDEEVEILAEVVPLAKTTYTQYRATNDRLTTKRLDSKNARYTVDTPVPYRMADVLSLLDARMGKLENRSSRMIYHKLISRIEAVCNDPRYAFMFENANVGGDTMGEILAQLFRLPPNGVPITVMQLTGFPSEVVDAVVSVLCRMAFDFGLWSDGAAPMLVVCEEAHRYAAADRSVGFGPIRRSLSRIAKEGRKYGVFLGLVTQRPAELDPTILSQCSTLFAMRMTNEKDQAILRSAVSDTATHLLDFLPSLGTGEAFAFGEGVALPTRLAFSRLPSDKLPKSEAGCGQLAAAEHGQSFIASVLERWRGSTTSEKGGEEAAPEAKPDAEAPPLQPTSLEPDRFKLLKRPLSVRPDEPAGSPRQPGSQPERWPAK